MWSRVLIQLRLPSREECQYEDKVFDLVRCLVIGFANSVYAQLVAGSPEDAAYKDVDNPRCTNYTALDFEKQFPQSKVLPDIYVMLMGIYQQKMIREARFWREGYQDRCRKHNPAPLAVSCNIR
jgi:hypothetical protein